MQCIGIIPARYGSTRFPGKPLADIGGKTMIKRVVEQAVSCDALSEVWVATDDQRIYDHVAGFGKVVMTSAHHPSGTDRCHEALEIIKKHHPIEANDVVVNIQGDEPFIQAEQIEALTRSLTDNPNICIATLVRPLNNQNEAMDENMVKCVFDTKGRAMYFSRLPIPGIRTGGNYHKPHYQHLGLYAFRAATLKQLVALPPGKLELTESLEQLRWMENGFDVHVEITHTESTSIDTPEDLKKLISRSFFLI